MLRIENLAKRYGDIAALDDVSLSLEPGEFFGLLGPNGAGRTTLMSLVAGIRPPDKGEMFLAGERFYPDRSEQRAQLGFVPQALALYEELSGEENPSESRQAGCPPAESGWKPDLQRADTYTPPGLRPLPR